MKSLIIILISIMTLGQAHAQSRGVLAKVFSFSSKSKASGKGNSCTATLINHNGLCHLLTNNHCVENRDDFQINFLPKNLLKGSIEEREAYSQQYALSDDLSPIKVGIKAINRRLDLAVLSFESTRLENLCNIIEPISKNDYLRATYPQLVKTFVATGVVKNKAVLKFSSDMSWANGSYGATQAFYKYDLGAGLYFWHVSDISIIPGMSGSPLINTTEGFIGIASKYVDFQNSALIIPTPLILEVLEGRIKDLPEMEHLQYKSNSASEAGNEHGGAGNEHGGAGNEHGGAGNEHGGAGNEHGGASDNAKRSTLQSFRAPDEGIIINNEMILGFTSKDGLFGKQIYHQIDGRDEYQVKVNDTHYLKTFGLKANSISMIKRPAQGPLELSLRKKLIERMDGVYYLEGHNHSTAKPFNQKKVEYVLAPTSAKGMAELSRKTTILMFNVDSKKNSISIESENLEMKFGISYSSDFSYIYLTSGQLKLTCSNKHLLKLICSGGGVEFSLSLNHTAEQRHIKYRLAYYDSILGVPGISYWFGAVSATNRPLDWRRD